MLVIPLQILPAQTVNVQLDTQPCQVNVYQKRTGLYLDLAVLDKPIVTGVVGRCSNRIVRDVYLGFVGDLSFFDTQGNEDPGYEGFGPGGRFFLGYLQVGIDL